MECINQQGEHAGQQRGNGFARQTEFPGASNSRFFQSRLFAAMVVCAAVVAWLMLDVVLPVVKIHAQQREIKRRIAVGEQWDDVGPKLRSAGYNIESDPHGGGVTYHTIAWQGALRSATIRLMIITSDRLGLGNSWITPVFGNLGYVHAIDDSGKIIRVD